MLAAIRGCWKLCKPVEFYCEEKEQYFGICLCYQACKLVLKHKGFIPLHDMHLNMLQYKVQRYPKSG